MAQQDLLGSDKLNIAYQKINGNFDELYAGAGSGGGGATDLVDLGDVDLTLPIGNNQALVYDNVANKWENQNIPRQLDDLTDLDIQSPANGDILVYNTARITPSWENKPNLSASQQLLSQQKNYLRVQMLMGVV